MGCDRHPYPGRLCVITCERTVISTVLPSLDERQVRHSHVIGPLVEGKGKENGWVCFDMFCLSLFPPFLSLRLSPVDYGSLFPMRLCLQDRCVNCGAKVSRPHLGQIYAVHTTVKLSLDLNVLTNKYTLKHCCKQAYETWVDTSTNKDSLFSCQSHLVI